MKEPALAPGRRSSGCRLGHGLAQFDADAERELLDERARVGRGAGRYDHDDRVLAEKNAEYPRRSLRRSAQPGPGPKTFFPALHRSHASRRGQIDRVTTGVANVTPM